MKTIYKYKLDTLDIQEVQMPQGAKILTVQIQHGEPNIWALVEPEYELEPRTIHTIGTGHPIYNHSLDYIGTYQIMDGDFVFHVFEGKSNG